MTFDIRPAHEANLAGILAIYNHSIENTTAVFSYKPHTLAMRREWFSAKQEANLPVFLAQSENDVVGFATYGPGRYMLSSPGSWPITCLASSSTSPSDLSRSRISGRSGTSSEDGWI